jgi:hypothetical protein
MADFNTLRDSFTRQIPAMQRNARSYFRYMPPDAQEEAVQNTLGLTWKAYRSLILKNRGEEPGILKACYRFSLKQTKEGRQIQGCPRVKDPFHARRFGKVTFEEIDPNEFIGRSTPIPEQVSFRLDVPAFFRKSLSPRDRKLAKDLSSGMSTTEAATKYDVSMGRISQFRREFMEKFRAYMSAE